MFTSLVLINSIYHSQLILKTIYDSIHIIHVILILISSHFIIIYTYHYIFLLLFLLISNWYMINTFVSNLGTAMVFVFVIVN